MLTRAGGLRLNAYTVAGSYTIEEILARCLTYIWILLVKKDLEPFPLIEVFTFSALDSWLRGVGSSERVCVCAMCVLAQTDRFQCGGDEK